MDEAPEGPTESEGLALYAVETYQHITRSRWSFAFRSQLGRKAAVYSRHMELPMGSKLIPVWTPKKGYHEAEVGTYTAEALEVALKTTRWR